MQNLKEMSTHNKLSEEKMLEALKRSGYLLESEISSSLSKAGFFVESNQAIEDPITGKSREIDITAEYYRYVEEKVICKTKFVFELKNNRLPLILLTKAEPSPNIEAWCGLKEAFTLPVGIDYRLHDSFYTSLIENEKVKTYTQYCSFQKKKNKDELMAFHPDNIHSGLSKIVEYCESRLELFEIGNPESISANEHFRHFLYMPILLINEDLYEMQEEKLIKVESSILVFNYHYKKESKMAYIFVVTKKGFSDFMDKIITLEKSNELKMVKIKKALLNTSS